jgi:protein-disulfide isomerase/uncharacterized membrane protein
MRKSKNIFILVALAFVIIATALHAYLASQHYDLKFGMSEGSSLCDFNAQFSCAAVAASEYSSLLGIPIAVFGIWLNLVLGVFLLAWLFTGSETPRWGRYSFLLSLAAATGSLVMIVIAITMMSVYCPFCIALYVISFIVFGLIWKNLGTPSFSDWKEDLLGPLQGRYALWGWLLVIPIGAWMVNQGAYKKVGGQNRMAMAIEDSLAQWEAGKKISFNTQTAISSGPRDAIVEIVEFADFRCSHCKHAVPVVSAFLSSHPDVRFSFLAFPLDGECNTAISRSSGLSCRLAKAAYCAEAQNPGKGILAKKWLFERQEQFSSLTAIDEQLQLLSRDLSYEWTALKECIDSEAAHLAVKAQAQQGADAEISGTPSFFINGKLLPNAQFLAILEAAYQRARAQSK